MNSTMMATVEQAKAPTLRSTSTQNPFLTLPVVSGFVMLGMLIGFLVIRRTWTRSVVAPETMLG